MLPLLVNLAGESASSRSESTTMILAATAATAVTLYTSYHYYIGRNKAVDKVTTTLTEPRGSEGLGLPSMLSPKTIEIIKATAPVVAPKALDITKSFYHHILGENPSLQAYFNPAHNVPHSTHQPEALAASIVAYASNIEDLTPLLSSAVPQIVHRHCALGVYPAQYTVVYQYVMAAIGRILGEAVTPEIAAAWSEAVLFLGKALIDAEENLYKTVESREGGWSGAIDFVVTAIDDVADNVKRFSFQPPKESPLFGKNFEFTAGQYLSINPFVGPDAPLSAPRHYTVTSPPGTNFFQCTVKKIQGGKVSTYMHEQLKVGDIVKLTAPYGIFTAPAETTSAVTVSAGIGITPMISLRRSLGPEKVKLAVHVDRSPFAHPQIDDNGSTTLLTKYTEQGDRPTPEALANEIVESVGTDHTFFVCGPLEWMNGVQSNLLKLGAKNVSCEVFGSQLSTGCPFMAHGSM